MLKQRRRLTDRKRIDQPLFQGLCVVFVVTAWFTVLSDVRAVDPDLPNSDPPNADQTDSSIGPRVLNQVFSLPATDGSVISVGADASVPYRVVCFLGAECPLANLYAPRLNRLATEFKDRGVRFIGINSNLQDSMPELAAYVKKHELVFPMVKDYDRAAALGFGASRTPEVFVVDAAGVIRYQGRIDDQYRPGLLRPKLERQDLRIAMEQVLSGKRVAVARTTATGCLISLPREVDEESEVTFCNQISRMLRKNCVECHRRGQIGPFALDQYDELACNSIKTTREYENKGRRP
jgi:peroxiredoxin